MSRLQPGDPAPDFCSQAVRRGEIVELTLDDALRGHQYLLLVFYPADFTFVCPTEIVQFLERWSDFAGQQCGVACCSTDSAYTHLAWLKAPKSERGLGASSDKAGGGEGSDIVLLSDRTHEIASAYGVLSADGAAYRASFLIGRDRSICQVTINDMPVGRSAEDALRMLREMRGEGTADTDQRARPASGCARPRQPPLEPAAAAPSHPQQLQQQQRPYQYLQQQQQQHHRQPVGCDRPGSEARPVATHPQQPPPSTAYQCEPQSFSLDQPVCSSLAAEAASLETQAAQLRVRDSEDRLAWMLAETDRLRSEADRLRQDTEQLKAEALRRQVEAERLLACQSACQAAAGGGGCGGGGGGSTTRSTMPEDCSWSTAGHRLQQQQQQQQQQPLSYHHNHLQPLQNQHQHQQLYQQQQRQHQLSAAATTSRQSHVCRRGANTVASHVSGGACSGGGGGHRC